MGFFEKLEELRQKPEGAKRRIVFAIVSFLMVLVILLWVETLSFERTTKNQSYNEGPRPWEVLKKTFEAGKKEIQEALRLRPKVYLRGLEGE